MTKKVRLDTTQEQFDGLHKAADTKRGTMCKVDKKALVALLIDHGRLVGYASSFGALEGHK